MGSVGAPELIVIFLVALIVLGPDRLPKAARQLGKAIAEFKRVSGGFQDEVRKALDIDGNEPSHPAPSAPPPMATPAPVATSETPPPGDGPQAGATLTGATPVDVDLPPPPDDPSRN